MPITPVLIAQFEKLLVNSENETSRDKLTQRDISAIENGVEPKELDKRWKRLFTKHGLFYNNQRDAHFLSYYYLTQYKTTYSEENLSYFLLSVNYLKNDFIKQQTENIYQGKNHQSNIGDLFFRILSGKSDRNELCAFNKQLDDTAKYMNDFQRKGFLARLKTYFTLDYWRIAIKHRSHYRAYQRFKIIAHYDSYTDDASSVGTYITLSTIMPHQSRDYTPEKMRVPMQSNPVAHEARVACYACQRQIKRGVHYLKNRFFKHTNDPHTTLRTRPTHSSIKRA